MIDAVTHHGTVCTSNPSPATKNEPSGINTVVSNDFASGRDVYSSSSEVSTGSRIVFEYRRIGRFTKGWLSRLTYNQDYLVPYRAEFFLYITVRFAVARAPFTMGTRICKVLSDHPIRQRPKSGFLDSACFIQATVPQQEINSTDRDR